MSYPCAVVHHVHCYLKPPLPPFPDATALRRGPSRSLLPQTTPTPIFRMPRPCAVVLHAHCYFTPPAKEGWSDPCSSKRETPRHKAVASPQISLSYFF